MNQKMIVITTTETSEKLAELENKTFQIHILPDRKLRLYLVEFIPQSTRCPVIVGGEQCGEERGHAGKHMWAGGD